MDGVNFDEAHIKLIYVIYMPAHLISNNMIFFYNCYLMVRIREPLLSLYTRASNKI